MHSLQFDVNYRKLDISMYKFVMFTHMEINILL